jgi:transforming growth factor-beta-induced protein
MFAPQLLSLGFAAAALVATVLPANNQECTSKCKQTPAAQTVSQAAKNIVELAQSTGVHKTLVQLVVAADLAGVLSGPGPLTVFAPTDEAFARLDPKLVAHLLDPKNKAELQAILKHHVVSGSVAAADVMQVSGVRSLSGQRLPINVVEGAVLIDGAAVAQADVRASNGIVHVIDRVLIPSTKNIVETAVGAGQFNTLAKALGAAGLVETLSGQGPFTVFAPTDEAFAKLDPKVLASLLEPANKAKLTEILTYHVVPGRLSADEAIAAGQLHSLQGGDLRLRIEGGRIQVGGASLLINDLETTNGTIHVIDSVLLP